MKKSGPFLFILLLILALGVQISIASDGLGFKVEKHQLNNGMMVLMIPDHSCPTVTVQVWYKTGSRNERPGITGISHLFEHMMFKGTKKYPKDVFDRLVYGNGGINNAWTSFDNTTYYEVMPSDKLEVALSLEADRMRNLRINEENLNSERNVVINERLWRFDNSPFGAMYEMVYNNAFIAHPYRWLPIGFVSDLRAITLDDCLSYYNSQYAPNNSFLVIAGDIVPADAIMLVNQYFGGLKAEKPIEPPKTVEPEQKGEKRADFHRAAQLPAFITGFKIPDGSHADMPAIRLAAKILFMGESSRLYHRLIYTEQKAVFVEGDAAVSNDPSLFYVMAQSAPGIPIADVEKVVYEEIDRLKTEPISEMELQKAKNQMESEFIMGLQSNESRGETVGAYEIDTGDYNNIFTYSDKIQSVKADDVMRVSKEYLNEMKRTVITLIPEQPKSGDQSAVNQ